MSVRRQVVAIDSFPTEAREALMAYDGKSIAVLLPYRCQQCGVLYRRGAASYQDRYCSEACHKAAIAEAEAAAKQRKAQEWL